MAVRLLAIAAVANTALAYFNSSPLVAWSSSNSPAINALPSSAPSSSALLDAILNADDVCYHDAVVIVSQPGLHASDLRTLSPHTHLSRTLASSPSSRQYPYLPEDNEVDLTALGERVATKCRSKLLQYSPGESDVTLEHGSKHVVCMAMPHLGQSARERKEAVHNHEATLAVELQAIAAAFPNHLVVFTGSPLGASFFKRQAPDVPDRPTLDLANLPASDFVPISHISSNANTTLPEGGILKRYQLLTPALITALLVAFFLLVPVLYMALNALASIQNPIRSDVGKTFNAQERKNQ
ncbi:hypothetical protein D9619_001113 [Psilocybe cf. subviscida]|uniref:Protein BIG1 n=1 Tax=Psilocybe cf. subviscida TaxID=2480587 RepID=A0A8H5BHI0_9AGAR|nr:hypothetical protein D9619_001113 [Psilocybe cf. subviscida]